MTVEELIARLNDMPPDREVRLSVPQPGDDVYPLDRLDLWEIDYLVLQGPQLCPDCGELECPHSEVDS